MRTSSFYDRRRLIEKLKDVCARSRVGYFPGNLEVLSCRWETLLDQRQKDLLYDSYLLVGISAFLFEAPERRVRQRILKYAMPKGQKLTVLKAPSLQPL